MGATINNTANCEACDNFFLAKTTAEIQQVMTVN